MPATKRAWESLFFYFLFIFFFLRFNASLQVGPSKTGRESKLFDKYHQYSLKWPQTDLFLSVVQLRSNLKKRITKRWNLEALLRRPVDANVSFSWNSRAKRVRLDRWRRRRYLNEMFASGAGPAMPPQLKQRRTSCSRAGTCTVSSQRRSRAHSWDCGVICSVTHVCELFGFLITKNQNFGS